MGTSIGESWSAVREKETGGRWIYTDDMRSLFVALVAAGVGACLLIAAPAQSGPKGKTKKAAAEVAECQDDTDCVLVAEGCCGCNEGGKQRAVPKKARETYEKKRAAICKNTMCPQLMSEDTSCVARAVCKEKKTCALSQ
jgi:hypothetical protein